MARSLVGRSHLTQAGSLGTFAWSAPEVLTGLPVTTAADVYSFGVVLWCGALARGSSQPARRACGCVASRSPGLALIASHIAPLPAAHFAAPACRPAREIVTGEIPARGRMRDPLPDECPAEAARLINRCLDVDSRVRPTAKQMVQALEVLGARERAEAVAARRDAAAKSVSVRVEGAPAGAGAGRLQQQQPVAFAGQHVAAAAGAQQQQAAGEQQQQAGEEQQQQQPDVEEQPSAPASPPASSVAELPPPPPSPFDSAR